MIKVCDMVTLREVLSGNVNLLDDDIKGAINTISSYISENSNDPKVVSAIQTLKNYAEEGTFLPTSVSNSINNLLIEAVNCSPKDPLGIPNVNFSQVDGTFSDETIEAFRVQRIIRGFDDTEIADLGETISMYFENHLYQWLEMFETKKDKYNPLLTALHNAAHGEIVDSTADCASLIKMLLLDSDAKKMMLTVCKYLLPRLCRLKNNYSGVSGVFFSENELDKYAFTNNKKLKAKMMKSADKKRKKVYTRVINGLTEYLTLQQLTTNVSNAVDLFVKYFDGFID